MRSISRQSFLRVFGLAAAGAAVGTAPLPAEAPLLPPPANDEDEAFWAAVRAEYALQPGLAYLNTGGLGPSPLRVQQLKESVARELQARVETGHARFEPARRVLARFLGAAPEEVAFVRNATEGNSIIAAGLPLFPGDEVIFDSHAHPGGSFPWLQQQRLRGVVVRLFEPDPTSAEGNVERVRALVNERTRVVQVSHVTAPTGIVLPVAQLAALCHERGLWLHVDGAQSAGMFPFSVSDLGCDSYATSGHKWVGAPHETGVLVVRKERLLEVQPILVGAHAGDLERLPGELVLHADARRFEYGTRNVAPVVGLAGAAEWLELVGPARIARRGCSLINRLRRGLQALPDVEVLTPAADGLAASMLTFRSPRRPYDRLFQHLWHDHGLRCRPVSEQGLDAVRVSCHLFNQPSEVDRLLEALARLLRNA